MPRTTPMVETGYLRQVSQPEPIGIDSQAWFHWLANEEHRCFHFVHPTGGFTARKERKQRGQWYWVAYRQVHGKLYKVYLGKCDSLTEAHLIDASYALLHCATSTEKAAADQDTFCTHRPDAPEED